MLLLVLQLERQQPCPLSLRTGAVVHYDNCSMFLLLLLLRVCGVLLVRLQSVVDGWLVVGKTRCLPAVLQGMWSVLVAAVF